MATQKRKHTAQTETEETCRKLRLWLIVGGVCSLGMGVLNILSSGYFEPYDGGQGILRLGCLGYSLALSRYPTCEERGIEAKSHNSSRRFPL